MTRTGEVLLPVHRTYLRDQAHTSRSSSIRTRRHQICEPNWIELTLTLTLNRNLCSLSTFYAVRSRRQTYSEQCDYYREVGCFLCLWRRGIAVTRSTHSWVTHNRRTSVRRATKIDYVPWSGARMMSGLFPTPLSAVSFDAIELPNYICAIVVFPLSRLSVYTACIGDDRWWIYVNERLTHLAYAQRTQLARRAGGASDHGRRRAELHRSSVARPTCMPAGRLYVVIVDATCFQCQPSPVALWLH